MVPESLHPVILKPTAEIAPVATRYTGLTRDGKIINPVDARAGFIADRPDIIMVCESLGLVVRPKGMNWVTNCIFHHDPGPSMVLYTGQNKFHCYGCEAHGDSRDLAAGRDMTGRAALIR